MAARKLFVSHSSKTPADLERLRAVCDGLKQRGYHLLVDKNAEFGNREAQIYPGSDWDLRLNEWLAECHAAVILFNSTALEHSDWVKKEAAVLGWRRELEADFTLIPVLLDGIQAEDLQKGLYGVLRIGKSQCISAGNDPDSIVQRVVDGLGSAGGSTDTPFQRLEQLLRDILQAQASAEALEDAWRVLEGEHKPTWQADQRARFAEALARLLLRDSTQTLKQLRQLIDRIRPRIRKHRAQELVDALACLWVDPRAVGGLVGAPHCTGAVALNGKCLENFTADRYLERAWPLSNLWRIIKVDQQAARSPEGFQEAIRAEFRPTGQSSDPQSDAWLDEDIKEKTEPVVVLVILRCDVPGQPRFPDAGVLRAIRERYPNLTLLFGTGPEPPWWLPDSIRLLEPPLDLRLEHRMQVALKETYDFLDRHYPQGASR